MQLYLIRHGQSANNAGGDDLFDRVEDPQLTETGKKQAQYLADFFAEANNREELVRLATVSEARKQRHDFGFTHLYVSAMHRALQTALPIGKAVNLKPEIWVDIHEHGGIYLMETLSKSVARPGLTRAQITAEFPDYVIPDEITENGWWNLENGEEDIHQCFLRAVKVVMALRQRAMTQEHNDDVVALITHGTFIDCVIKAITEGTRSTHYYHHHYNTGVTRFDLWRDGRVMIRYINRVEHLPPELVT